MWWRQIILEPMQCVLLLPLHTTQLCSCWIWNVLCCNGMNSTELLMNCTSNLLSFSFRLQWKWNIKSPFAFYFAYSFLIMKVLIWFSFNFYNLIDLKLAENAFHKNNKYGLPCMLVQILRFRQSSCRLKFSFRFIVSSLHFAEQGTLSMVTLHNYGKQTMQLTEEHGCKE